MDRRISKNSDVNREAGGYRSGGFEKMFSPVEIGGIRAKNRIVQAPMQTNLSGYTEGEINERLIQYYMERAKGGVGTIVVGASAVDWDTCKSPIIDLLHGVNAVESRHGISGRITDPSRCQDAYVPRVTCWVSASAWLSCGPVKEVVRKSKIFVMTGDEVSRTTPSVAESLPAAF